MSIDWIHKTINITQDYLFKKIDLNFREHKSPKEMSIEELILRSFI